MIHRVLYHITSKALFARRDYKVKKSFSKADLRRMRKECSSQPIEHQIEETGKTELSETFKNFLLRVLVLGAWSPLKVQFRIKLSERNINAERSRVFFAD